MLQDLMVKKIIEVKELLNVSNLSKIYSIKNNKQKAKVKAVDNVSFTLEDGVFCAVVGESGSGKTTLSQMLACLIMPTEGTIEVDNIKFNELDRHGRKEIHKKIQLILQDSKSALDPHMSIYDSIVEPLRNMKKVSRDEEKRRIYEIAEVMDLQKESLKKKPDSLSGGQLKRACIARALICEPEIVIFDEAITGLDVIVRKKVLDLIKKLHEKTGSIYIFITHDMDVALYLASKVLVMKDGKIVEDVEYSGNKDEFTHPYSKLLIESM